MSDSLEAMGDLRSLTLSAGQIHNRFVAEITAHVRLSKGERLSHTRAALEQLVAGGHVSAGEAGQLTEILGTVHDEDIDSAAIAERVAATYETMKGEEAGPVSLAIAGIAADSTETVKIDQQRKAESSVEFEIFDLSHSVGQLDCEGGIVGATLGLLGGSPASVAGGALVGAAVASGVAYFLSE